MSTDTLTIDLEALAIEYTETRDKIAKADDRHQARTKKDRDRLAEIETEIAKHAPVGDSVQGSKQIRATPGKKIDKAKLKENYPQAEYPQFWTSDISATEVKKEIGENEYARYQLPNGKTTLTINDTI